ncbi:hypothetical protein LSH36_1010g00085 [Paralvinella palmiformis]|uniref:Centrosomal protein of 70 kDa n=1 Tax=Paralvinella palmiformis TaxID=53620 RepID=A0AAD9IW00_9ANNE|nr:hypothetical protein LSH36_1010g00085 [Paralvinella palmiformis]
MDNCYYNSNQNCQPSVDDFTRFYFKVEVEEWVYVNKELRHHGFPLVELVEPSQIQDVSDLVLLRSDTARKLRKTLITLIKDCDRRQELVQELIITNTQLREELKTQSSISEKYEVKTRDLQSLLDDSKVKVQELEEEKWNLSVISKGEGDRLRNTKDAAAARNVHLVHKCDLYKEEVERLQAKLKHINIEEEKRKKKQTEVLQQLRRKWTSGSGANDHMLTVIDWYETQIAQLKQELNLIHCDGTAASSELGNISVNSSAVGGATGNYKALVKSYERQLRDSKKSMKALENETELLKLDLQSRPHINDLRDSQGHVKKLERVLKIHGIRPTLHAEKKSKLLFSTKVEDVEFLPVSQCRQYLKAVCQELDVDDVEKAQSRVRQLVMDSESLPHLKVFSEAVIEAVKPKLKGQQGVAHAIWCEKTKHQVITTLQQWSLQIESNQELQQSIHRLVTSLFPLRRLENLDNPTTTDLIQQIDNLLVDDEGQEAELDPVENPEENPPKSMLQEIVSHFQMLFDVPSIKGIYVCMSDLYTRLGEVNNIVKTLKDLLDLETDCKVSAIVEAVAELRNSHHEVTSDYLCRVLGTDDLDSVVQKLQEHEDFFPVFHELLQKIMETLSEHVFL